MNIPASQYQEAYRYAKKVVEGELRPAEAIAKMRQLGLNKSSAGDFLAIYRRMLSGEVYKRAMSVDATEFFISQIRSDLGKAAFRNSLNALRLHIPYNHYSPNGVHAALLARYESGLSFNVDQGPPAVRIIPMSADESDGFSISEVQSHYFLKKLPRYSDCGYRYKTKLIAPRRSVILFQYEGHLVASATFLDAHPFDQPDRFGYRGALRLERSSIRTFRPIAPEKIREIWPKFRRLSHVKQELDPKRYYLFETAIEDVRRVGLSAEDGVEDDREQEGDYSSRGQDSQSKIWRQIRDRRGQGKFRNDLRNRYGSRCMITGCEILDILEAAHIVPYRGACDHHPRNGLLLRADIHTLFDLNLLGIEPKTLAIKLNSKIAREYGYLKGTVLKCHGRNRPSEEALKTRFDEFSLPGP